MQLSRMRMSGDEIELSCCLYLFLLLFHPHESTCVPLSHVLIFLITPAYSPHTLNTLPRLKRYIPSMGC